MESVTTTSVFVWTTGVLGVIAGIAAEAFTTGVSSDRPQLTRESIAIQEKMQIRKKFFTAQPSVAGVLPPGTTLKDRECASLVQYCHSPRDDNNYQAEACIQETLPHIPLNVQ